MTDFSNVLIIFNLEFLWSYSFQSTHCRLLRIGWRHRFPPWAAAWCFLGHLCPESSAQVRGLKWDRFFTFSNSGHARHDLSPQKSICITGRALLHTILTVSIVRPVYWFDEHLISILCWTYFGFLLGFKVNLTNLAFYGKWTLYASIRGHTMLLYMLSSHHRMHRVIWYLLK